MALALASVGAGALVGQIAIVAAAVVCGDGEQLVLLCDVGRGSFGAAALQTAPVVLGLVAGVAAIENRTWLPLAAALALDIGVLGLLTKIPAMAPCRDCGFPL